MRGRGYDLAAAVLLYLYAVARSKLGVAVILEHPQHIVARIREIKVHSSVLISLQILAVYEAAVCGIGFVHGYPIVLKSGGSGVVDCDLLACAQRGRSGSYGWNADIKAEGSYRIIGHIVHADLIRPFCVRSLQIQLAGGTGEILV